MLLEYFESKGQPLKDEIKCLLTRVSQDNSSVVTVGKRLLAALPLGAHSDSTAQSLDHMDAFSKELSWLWFSDCCPLDSEHLKPQPLLTAPVVAEVSVCLGVKHLDACQGMGSADFAFQVGAGVPPFIRKLCRQQHSLHCIRH